jgi:hypothetical protein
MIEILIKHGAMIFYFFGKGPECQMFKQYLLSRVPHDIMIRLSCSYLLNKCGTKWSNFNLNLIYVNSSVQ